MRYISTRGQSPPVSFLDAVLAGMAPDGGLYVPEEWPGALDNNAFRRDAATSHFASVATQVIEAFAGESLTQEHSRAISQRAYLSEAWPRAVTPLVQTGPGDWMLELFHGPSLSFKDVAMQLIAPLYDVALGARDARLTVICATSGDTGGAAVEALKRTERVDLFVLTPAGRVSDVQRRFMTTSGASNVHTLEIGADFDACQAIVKALFADQTFVVGSRLSGVNSINWARILAQSVYYHIAASVLSGPGRVSFVVPTGNFGDAYSGWAAKRTGAPIGGIGLATNANDILARAIRTGRYERSRQAYATLSPAMDIQVASNFERILFESLGRDAERVGALYGQFAQSGGFDIPPEAMKLLWDDFNAAAASDSETKDAMIDPRSNYLACPHTAVGLHGRSEMARWLGGNPCVTLATAHPAKFPDTVERATGVRPQLPARCADLFEREERFDSLPADAEAVKRYIRERSRAWQ